MSSVKKFRILKFKSKPILTVKGVSKSIDKRIILRKIDLLSSLAIVTSIFLNVLVKGTGETVKIIFMCAKNPMLKV